ncbi:MFS transporter [Kitasatospora sp. NPDC048365]|uniref:MFS transporter n=1 Tax=Kitasatospora sp. NPDC048365 TaxID=3364050 RepID=UPI0037191DB1
MAALATPATRPDRPARPVIVGLVLVATAYVMAPVLQAAALPVVRTAFGLTPSEVAGTKIVGVLATVVTLFAAGRAGDVWGRRTVVLWALGALAAGCAVLTFTGDPWTYRIAHTVVNTAIAAVFVSCLAALPALNAPGRMTRVLGGWLALQSLAYLVATNLAPRSPSMLTLRLITAVGGLVVIAVLVLVRRTTPPGTRGGADARLDRPFVACLVGAVVLLAAGLLLAPVWSWTDPRVLALLTGSAATALAARLRAGNRAARRQEAVALPRKVAAMALAAGLAVGFTQVVLQVAVPLLTTAAGAGPARSALTVSAFGAGGALGCLLARRLRITALTGCSLGLPLAAVGLALLHFLPGSATAATVTGSVLVALVGLGVMIAQVPQMAWFLAALPRARLGFSAALHPVSILLGTVAAQALPYTSVLSGSADTADAHELLWIGTGVVAVAALLVGRPTVALAVAAAAGLEYLLVRGLASEHHAEKPITVVIALLIGAGAGLLAWQRGRTSDRLARARATVGALQDAVLHPIPARLGRLHLAGLYQPATADTGIGGDFLEAVHTPYGTRILIGDVRGKGLEAVRTVTDLLGCFRSQAHETPDLGELVARMDRQLVRAAAARGDEELFATALLIEDRAGEDLRVVNCGHLAPLTVGPDGHREHDVPALLPLGLGLLGDDTPEPATVPLADHDVLVLHTDGLSEARNSSGEFYPLAEGLAAARAGGRTTTPTALVRHLEQQVHDWTHHLTDDIAIIALTRRHPTD